MITAILFRSGDTSAIGAIAKAILVAALLIAAVVLVNVAWPLVVSAVMALVGKVAGAGVGISAFTFVWKLRGI